MKNSIKPMSRILAVSSGGGHWAQLMRLRPALAGHKVTYVTVDAENRADVQNDDFYQVPDANRTQKVRLIGLLLRLAWILVRVRPHVVITTGAAPGYLAIRFGKLLGARSMFIDSIANAEHLSLSAHLAERHANVVLTQWPHLAKQDGPFFKGSVI